jgi:hypothetical protein
VGSSGWLSNFKIRLESYHKPSFTLKILIIRNVFGARVVIAHPEQDTPHQSLKLWVKEKKATNLLRFSCKHNLILEA